MRKLFILLLTCFVISACNNTVQTTTQKQEQIVDSSHQEKKTNRVQQPKAEHPLMTEITTEAKQGKLFCEFAIGTNKADVIQQWGEPNKKDEITLTYDNKYCEFLVTDGKSITGLMTKQPKFTKLTMEEVNRVLGSPEEKVDVPENGLSEHFYPFGEYSINFVYNTKSKFIQYIELSSQ